MEETTAIVNVFMISFRDGNASLMSGWTIEVRIVVWLCVDLCRCKILSRVERSSYTREALSQLCGT